MNGKNLYNQFTQSSLSTQLAVVAVAAGWAFLFIIMLVWAFLYLGGRGQAQEATPVSQLPVVTVVPASGSAGDQVTVQGEGWPAGNPVLIFLVSPTEANIPDFAVANAVTGVDGRFTTQFT